MNVKRYEFWKPNSSEQSVFYPGCDKLPLSKVAFCYTPTVFAFAWSQTGIA